MNIQLKSTLIIIVTFIIGMAVGILGFITMVKPPHPGGFKPDMPHHILKMRFERIIAPSEKQWEEIRPILRKYSLKMSDKMKRNHEELRLQKDSLLNEIKPFLTQEQIKKLEEDEKRIEESFGRGHGRPEFHPDKRQGIGPGMPPIGPGMRPGMMPDKLSPLPHELLDSIRKSVREEIKNEMKQGKD
ncbi:MAG: hypothetical protein ABIA63_04605 [bacterium]